MGAKRKTAGAGPFWVSSVLLAIAAVAAIGFGLSGGPRVSDDQVADRGATGGQVEPGADPMALPDPAPVAHAKPEPPADNPHQARFRAEQQTETARLLAKHPPLRMFEISASARRVEVIALSAKTAPASELDGAADYETYKATALGQRELVALHITRKEPFFLMLLSDGPVTYDVQTQVTGALRGVLISSGSPSTIEGLPDDVPLEIVSGEAEVEPFARRPRAEDDRAALESGLREIFPAQEIGIKTHDDSPVILVR